MRDKEEMLVESNERVDDEQRVKSEPASEWLAVSVVESGTNVVSEIYSDESTDM